MDSLVLSTAERDGMILEKAQRWTTVNHCYNQLWNFYFQSMRHIQSKTMMATFNLSSFNSGPFILLGIPGLEQFHIWIGIPFFIIYLVALVSNSALLYLIYMERRLHEPMFFFLSLLAATDLILSNTCVPKTFSIFWLGPQEITFPGCLTQMFFLHYSFAMDSAILLAMAFDRYVAIFFPLRYTTILTRQIITKIVMVLSAGAFVSSFHVCSY